MSLFDQDPHAFKYYLNDTFRPQHQEMVAKILGHFCLSPAGLLFICSYLTKAEVAGKMNEALAAASEMLEKHFAYKAPEARHILTIDDFKAAKKAYDAIDLPFPAHPRF